MEVVSPFASEKAGQSLRDSVFVILCGKDVVDSRGTSMKADSYAGCPCGFSFRKSENATFHFSTTLVISPSVYSSYEALRQRYGHDATKESLARLPGQVH